MNRKMKPRRASTHCRLLEESASHRKCGPYLPIASTTEDFQTHTLMSWVPSYQNTRSIPLSLNPEASCSCRASREDDVPVPVCLFHAAISFNRSWHSLQPAKWCSDTQVQMKRRIQHCHCNSKRHGKSKEKAEQLRPSHEFWLSMKPTAFIERKQCNSFKVEIY